MSSPSFSSGDMLRRFRPNPSLVGTKKGSVAPPAFKPFWNSLNLQHNPDVDVGHLIRDAELKCIKGLTSALAPHHAHFVLTVYAPPAPPPPVCHLAPPLLTPDYWTAGALLPSAVSPSTSTFTFSTTPIPRTSHHLFLPPVLCFFWGGGGGGGGGGGFTVFRESLVSGRWNISVCFCHFNGMLMFFFLALWMWDILVHVTAH